MTDDHGALRDDLPLLASGDLAPDRARQLHDHLSDCAGCAAELAELADALDALRAATPADPDPPDVAALMAARLSLAGAARPARLRWLAQAAALLLAFAAGVGSQRLGPPAVTPAPPTRPTLARPTPVAAEPSADRLQRAYRRSLAPQDQLSRALLGLAALQREED